MSRDANLQRECWLDERLYVPLVMFDLVTVELVHLLPIGKLPLFISEVIQTAAFSRNFHVFLVSPLSGSAALITLCFVIVWLLILSHSFLL
jgi:hypothetical protein